MKKDTKAWIYCAIDAPEDIHGALKEQFTQLCDYAEQMGFETVGSSSDCGMLPINRRKGFGHFIKAAENMDIDILLITNRSVLPHSSIQLAEFKAVVETLDIEVRSPSEGKIIIR